MVVIELVIIAVEAQVRCHTEKILCRYLYCAQADQSVLHRLIASTASKANPVSEVIIDHGMGMNRSSYFTHDPSRSKKNCFLYVLQCVHIGLEQCQPQCNIWCTVPKVLKTTGTTYI